MQEIPFPRKAPEAPAKARPARPRPAAILPREAQPDLCPTCLHGARLKFAKGRPEWVCKKQLYTRLDRQIGGGAVAECEEFEKR
ncbi:MAG: hypothetical protein AB1405_01015 [Bdellovibrionota bacterium]